MSFPVNLHANFEKIGVRIKKLMSFSIIFGLFLGYPFFSLAQSDFNPHFIISDAEMLDFRSWTKNDVQMFLDSRGSYLRNYQTEDASGTVKTATDIIYDASERYQINPKFLLVTLQKEQSLITDDAPAERQLNWATGYGVCDGCSTDNPDVLRHIGFGRQVDSAAGAMRWYYDNSDCGYVRKKDEPTLIDGQSVIPQSWATAFLYTYTPHLHGNQNFWRIWNTWFSQVYPNNTLLRTASTSEYWLLQNGKRRKFKNMSVLISRTDPKTAITVPDIELGNYEIGSEISYANYSILETSSTVYLVDYDEIRPFESREVVRQLGYNPQEFITVSAEELTSSARGSIITASTTAPQGIIYQITDRGNNYYLLKDNTLYPILDKRVVDLNYKALKVERHHAKDLSHYQIADYVVNFTDGTLIRLSGMNKIYVIDHGAKRPIADHDTFVAMGYKQSNIVQVSEPAFIFFPEGEPIYLNGNLLSSRNKFLGDSLSPVSNLFTTRLPAYLAAEYPSGRIIAGKDVDTRRSIASLAKLLTAYQVLEEGVNLNNGTVYNRNKHSSYGNSLHLQNGEKIRNRDLLNAMLVNSVNATGHMLAQATGLDERAFVSRVNRQLENWGADNTTIADVTGLDENNKSSPRDLLKIFTKVLSNDTLKTILGKTEYKFTELVNKNKYRAHALKNTNQLIAKPGRNYRILASKTGYTEEAEAVLIMLIESKKTKKQYVTLTMGDTDYRKRFDEPNRLAEWVSTNDMRIANNQ